MQQRQQQPPVIFSVCTPSDVQGLERWETHLHPLEQAGILSSWSALHLQAGVDRLQQLHKYLDQADIIVLLLSADFFTDNECIELMGRALARHQEGTARLIPLLLRPVSWRETELATFTPLPSNGSPVTQWPDLEAAFDDCVRSLRRLLGRRVTQPLAPHKREEQNRERMLLRLQYTYEQLSTQSLQDVTQMELELAHKPDAVQSAITILFQTSTRQEQLLPPGTSILRVYDESMDELLILGAPGAGKSTLLIKLARQLLERAKTDAMHPLPVILPLSSWATKRPPLHLWLAEQVAQIYNIPKKVARLWIDEDRLLPLLDGLDEMDETARSVCITAINVYHRNHLLLPLVVCSRQAEYEGASRSQRLELQNAVVVQPLTHEQVQAYLVQMGKPLSSLLSTNPALSQIATTPLMVHILILAYRGTLVRPLSTQRELLQRQIWRDYVQHMVERKRDKLHYQPHQIVTWLSFLARQMQDHHQTIFSLEQLQPDWLTKKQKGIYRLSVGLVYGLVTGLVVGIFWLVFGLVSDLSHGVDVVSDLSNGLQTGLFFGLIFGLFFGLIAGLFFGLKRKIEPAEALTWSWRNWKSRVVVGLSWLILVLVFGLVDGWLNARGSYGWDYVLAHMLADMLVDGVFFGLPSGLVVMLVFGFSGKQLIERLTLSPNEGIRRSLKNGLVFGLVFWLFLGLFIGMLIGVIFVLASRQSADLSTVLFLGLLPGLSIGLISGLFSGLGAVTQHYVLRFWLWRTHVFPWKPQRFLDDAVTCILQRRVGGSYNFVHRLLMDHLAYLSIRHTQASAAHLPTSVNALPADNSPT